ncbi:MAG: alpha-glucosidase [Flavobacteriales bacterium]|nr:alpha-glucosidase [Flavobacteriales bacterium]
MRTFLIFLFLLKITVVGAQTFNPSDAKATFYNGTFQYKGKLGSYKVKRKDKPNDVVTATICRRVNDQNLIVVLPLDETIPIDITELKIPVSKGLHFFGGGEQFSHLELTGKHVPFLVEENGIGRGDKPATKTANLVGAGGHEWTTYCPIPLILSTDNKAYLIENDCYSEIDLTVDGEITFIVHDHELKLRTWEANSPKELLEKITADLGRMPQLPDWTYGTILGIQGGAERVKQLVKDAQGYGNPVSAIWIQDWVGKKQTSIGSRLRWEWKPDTLTYPNFKQFCADMNAQDIKVMGYINPFLLEETDMTNQALEKGYIVHKKNGSPYLIPFGGFKGYIIDLSNPSARNWIKNIIKTNMIGNGLSGWMADFAEWLPFDCKLHSGQSPKDYHNRFAADWAKVNREAVEEAGKLGEVVFFSRSGFTGSSGISTLFWAGDQMVDFGENDGLGSAITAMLSSGLSGMSLNHSDIGGYTALKFPLFKNVLRDKEILFRWIELEAFTPLFRTHEGLLPNDMVQYYSDNETKTYFSAFAKIHKAMTPLFKHLVKEASETGVPVIRHPWLVCPTDTNCLQTKNQFFVGDDLLVLPVTERKQTTVRGYFPEGKWMHYFTKEVLEGGAWHEVEAPLGTPAVFLRK